MTSYQTSLRNEKLVKSISDIRAEINELESEIRALKNLKSDRLFPQHHYPKGSRKPLTRREKLSLQNYRQIIRHSGMNTLTRKGQQEYLNLEKRL